MTEHVLLAGVCPVRRSPVQGMSPLAAPLRSAETRL